MAALLALTATGTLRPNVTAVHAPEDFVTAMRTVSSQAVISRLACHGAQ